MTSPAFDTAIDKSDPFYDGLIGLSIEYAKIYQKDGKNFIRCFLKYGTIREVCHQINNAYKSKGIEPEGDFSGYVEKLNLEEKWKGVLDQTLRIIYTISQ